MPLTTEVFRYGGVDLRSMGLYMSLVDGMLSTPPVRGSNVLIPYQPGTRWVQKYYDQRHIVLAGELISLKDRIDFQAKIDTLKALFPIGAGEQKLEIQRADGSFRYVMAEVINTMGLQWVTFPTRSSTYSIELVASDPIWYGSLLQGPGWALDSGVLLDDGQHWFDQGALTLTTSPVAVDAPNSGDIYSRKPLFYLRGAMINPWIVNQRNGFSLQLLVTTGVSDLLVIDCGAQTATKNGAPLAANLIVLGSGQTDWLRLEPGSNSLQINLGFVSPISVNYQAFYSPAYL